MSAPVIWAPDSDSDPDYESRSKRICDMESRYLSGSNLFIMSASIKGELENNPWARKRKRTTAKEKLGDFYGAVKPVQNSQSAKSSRALQKSRTQLRGQSEVEHAQSSSMVPSDLTTKTPLWDRNSARPVDSKGSKSIARLIDFQQFDSQAPAVLLPKRMRIVTSVHHQKNIDQMISIQTEPDVDLKSRANTSSGQSSKRAIFADSGPPKEDRALELSSNHLVEARRTSQSLSNVLDCQSDLSHPARSSSIGDYPKFLASQNGEERQSVIVAKDADNMDTMPEPDSNVQQVAHQGQTCPNLSSGNEPIPTYMISTQAELASAKRGLIGALQLSTTSPLPRSRSPTASGSVSPTRHERSIPKSPINTSEKHDDDMLTRIPPSSPLNAQSANAGPKQSRTPTQPMSSALPCFAQFRSPVATQNSFLAFGSPLTFSPERPERSRKDQTINDIHKYLSESAFDVDDEAKRMLDGS